MSNGVEGLPPIRVLGIGSPFGADDVGWRLIDALTASPSLGPFLKRELLLASLDRPGAALLRYLENARHVLLLDAVVDDTLPIGTARRYSLDDIQNAPLLSSSHAFGVQQALSLAAALDQLPDSLALCGVSIGADFPDTNSQTNDWPTCISAIVLSLEDDILRLCTGLRGHNVTN